MKKVIEYEGMKFNKYVSDGKCSDCCFWDGSERLGDDCVRPKDFHKISECFIYHSDVNHRVYYNYEKVEG